jgi:hypothetical protein
MKKTIVIFGTILFIAISSCSNKEVKDEAIETVDSSAIAPQPKLDSIPNQSKSFNGNYTNSQGAILTITNFIASEGFTLKYSDNSKGTPCSGNAWEGKVSLASATNGVLINADGQEEGNLELRGKSIHFELSPDYIGMECARFFDADFVKK